MLNTVIQRKYCRGIQTILATPKGFRITTPQAPIESDTAALKLLSLHCTRELIELDIADSKNEKVKLHLQEAYTEMTRAIYFAESVAK